MIIGLTGKNGAGKGEAAEFLVQSGYVYHSLSDSLRDELNARKLEITRDNLTDVGTELRTKHGAGILAERILEKIPVGENAVVDSVRNPFEVEVLRRRKDFFLLAITAQAEIRFERIRNRGRENDPKTYEDFVKMEAREAQSDDPNAQQLNRTETMTDARIINEGNKEELCEKVREVILAFNAENSTS